MCEGGHYFWLGASADADPATHEPSQSALSRPCGECPLRGEIEKARNELVNIPLEVVEKHLDRAFLIISRAVDGPA